MRSYRVEDGDYSAIWVGCEENRLLRSDRANELINGKTSQHAGISDEPPLGYLCGQQVVALILKDGRRLRKSVHVIKPISAPRIFQNAPSAKGSARMSPPTLLRKRPNKGRGRGKGSCDGDWRGNSYFKLLFGLVTGDQRAQEIVDGTKGLRYGCIDDSGVLIESGVSDKVVKQMQDEHDHSFFYYPKIRK